MGRLVEPKQKQFTLAATGTPQASVNPSDTIQDYAERVAKFVPAEVLAFYIAAINLVSAVPEDAKTKRLWLSAIVGLFFWIVTPIWLGRFSSIKTVKRTNQIVGFFAFLIWAYAYPVGWFYERHYSDPIVAGLILIAFTVISAFIRPK